MSRWPLFSISPGNEEEMNSRSATLGLTNEGSLPNVDQLCTVIIYLILFSVYCMANGIRSPSVFTCFVCVFCRFAHFLLNLIKMLYHSRSKF